MRMVMRMTRASRARASPVLLYLHIDVTLAANRAAVVLGDDDAGRARAAAGGTVGPRAVCLRIRGIVARIARAGQIRRLAWMLDADEHRPLVGRDEHAGHLAVHRTNEETARLARDRIGA